MCVCGSVWRWEVAFLSKTVQYYHISQVSIFHNLVQRSVVRSAEANNQHKDQLCILPVHCQSNCPLSHKIKSKPAACLWLLQEFKRQLISAVHQSMH